MRGEYPNLPLIEERFSHAIHKELIVAKEKSSEKYFFPTYQLTVFKQSFPNRAGLRQRRNTFSGQAFTDYYITVIWEERTQIYGVFQGNDPVYRVENGTQKFFEDLKNQTLADIEHAEQMY